MIGALSARLRTIPGAYEAVRIVKIDAITINTGETYIPSATAARTFTGCSISNAVDIWRTAGYRPQQKSSTLGVGSPTTSAPVFPDKLLAMDVIHANDFPPMDEQGQQVTRNSRSHVNVTQTLVDIALRKFPNRMAIVWDGLTAFLSNPIVVSAGRSGAVIAWQTNERGGINGGSLCGPAAPPVDPCSDATYQAILDHGIDLGGHRIEIWPVNVEKFPHAVQAAQQRLRYQFR